MQRNGDSGEIRLDLEIEPDYEAKIVEQHEKGSVSHLDGNCCQWQSLLHINEPDLESVLESDPNQAHTNVVPDLERLSKIMPVGASESLSST